MYTVSVRRRLLIQGFVARMEYEVGPGRHRVQHSCKYSSFGNPKLLLLLPACMYTAIGIPRKRRKIRSTNLGMIAILEPAKQSVSGGGVVFQKKSSKTFSSPICLEKDMSSFFSFPFFGVKNEGYKWALGRKRQREGGKRYFKRRGEEAKMTNMPDKRKKREKREGEKRKTRLEFQICPSS